MNRSSKRNLKKNLFIFKYLFLSVLVISNLLFLPVAYGEKTFDSPPALENKNNIGSEEKEKSKSVGFTVVPVLPATQIDKSKGYFYAQVKPGEVTTLTLKVRSTIKEARTVKINVENAYTSQSGNIDYGGKNYTRDETLTDSLEEITDISEKEVTVENFEEKEITISITPPKESFDGVKAAAISVMNVEPEESNGMSSSFGYRVGLMIAENAEIEYNDGSSLNFLKVKPTVHQGKRVIQSTFQNPEPKILDKLEVETKLREKGSSEVLRKRKTTNMRMAPNSQFDFATDWGIDPIKPGTYVLSVKAKSGTESWSWQKEFTIGEEQARKINEDASYTITYPKWVPIVVILLGLLTIINIGSLYVRRKKWSSFK